MSHFFVPTASVVDTKINWKNGRGEHESHSTAHIDQFKTAGVVSPAIS
jgi:hypothetical protein